MVRIYFIGIEIPVFNNFNLYTKRLKRVLLHDSESSADDVIVPQRWLDIRQMILKLDVSDPGLVIQS